MYTGGGLRTRQRISRCWYAASILLAQLVVCIVNWAITRNELFTRRSTFAISVKDVIVAAILSLIAPLFTSLIPYLFSHVPCDEEFKEIECVKDENPKKRIPRHWSRKVGSLMSLFFNVLLVGLWIVALTAACGLTFDDSVAFARRFIIQLFLWIIITEPIKGVIAAYFILKWHPSHAITSEIDEAILPLEYAADLYAPPDFLKNETVGTTELDLIQLNQNEAKRTREEQLFDTLRSVACLLVALAITMGLVVFYRDTNAYYYQQQVRSLLNVDPFPFGPQAFSSINQIDQFWIWARNSLAPALFAKWYDGNPAWDMRGYANDKVSRAMGIGHIRQVRSVVAPKCPTAPELAQYFHNCTADISHKTEDRTPQYGPGWTEYDPSNNSQPRDEYRYKSAEELQSIAIDGQLRSYTEGGYTVQLKGPVDDLIEVLDRLRSETWIDEHTRGVFVEFSMYNAQVNYFAVVQMVIEIPAEGYPLPSCWVEAVRLIKYNGDDGGIIAVFEFLYVAYAILSFLTNTFIYARNVAMAFANRPRSCSLPRLLFNVLFGRFWDLLDFLVGILAIISVVAFVLRQINIQAALRNFEANNGNVYINLALQRDMELMFTFCLSGVVFFVSCRMIKILRFNRRIAILADTLDNASLSITDFAVVFLLIFCAFNMSLYCLLWERLESYRSPVATFGTTTTGMLGKFVVSDMFRISLLASTVFMVFMYTGTLFLINIFIMIILFEFERVRNDSSRQTNEYELLDHIQTKISRSVGLYSRQNLPACYVQDTLKDAKLLNALEAKADLLLHRVYKWHDEDDRNYRIVPERVQDISDHEFGWNF